MDSVDRFLVDAQCGAQSVDAFHPWLFHLAKELPCVARQGLHEAPLALLVNGVEGQGRFALPLRPVMTTSCFSDVDIDITQIVFRCALDSDEVHRFPALDYMVVCHLAVRCAPL